MTTEPEEVMRDEFDDDHDDESNGGSEARNPLGTAGLVVSIIGILTAGLLSPVGLVLSLCAIGRRPKNRALAGIIIGALGLAILVSVGLGWFFFREIMSDLDSSREKMTAVNMTFIATMVRLEKTRTGEPPEDLRFLREGTRREDGWGRPIVYRPLGERFELRSRGADGILDNADDIVLDEDYERR